MKKLTKVFAYMSFVFAFCFLAIGYAAVQDELLVNGTISVDGYILKYDLSAADIEGYTYDATTKTVEIKDIYYDTATGKNYKVVGIAANGFSSEKINEVKAENSDLPIDATTIEAFSLSEGVSQIGANAFTGLKNLKTFAVDDGNTSFKVVNSILFNADETMLVRYPSLKEGNYYIVPSTVTTILDGAFSENTNCTAIVTELYDIAAWGSPGAFMINASEFSGKVAGVDASDNGAYKVYLGGSVAVNDPVVLQGGDDPEAGIWGTPRDEVIASDTESRLFINVSADLCSPLANGHYAQVYVSSWKTIAYGYLNSDTLEIHNCRTAIVGGEVYQWVDGVNERVLLNNTVYRLPSGTVDGSGSLPESFADWSSIKTQVNKVDVIDSVAPTSVSNWFRDMTACTEMDLVKLNTENITTMYGMFWGCEKLTALNVSHFNTSNVKSMSYMFARCLQLTGLDVSSFDTANVTDMSYMFAKGKKLETISLLGTNFSTAEVTTMENMFAGCESLKELNLSHFNTAKVKNMARMFNLNYSLETLSLSSNFTTANVTSMTYMFNDCSALDELDISSFDTNKVTNMDYMFHSCVDLKKIIVSDTFVTRAVSSSTNMFNNCTKLVGGNGTTLDTVQATGVTAANSYKATYAKIDEEGQLGYFTAKTAD